MNTYLFVAALAGIAAFQAPATSPPTVSADATALSTAVRALDTGRGSCWVGEVDERKAESEGDMGLGGIVINAGGGDSAEPFRGSIEVLATEKKELLIASLRLLPEVVIYDDGSRQLVRTTTEEQPVSASRLSSDLVALLDFTKLAGQIEKATKIKAGEVASDGSRTLECELSPRLVRTPNGGMLAMMAPKVLSLSARFELDGKGAIQGLEFRVTRSDPFAGVRRQAVESAGRGGGAIQVAGTDLGAGDEEGATSVYRLRLKGDLPSPHAREALVAMRRICEQKKD